jgi:hypothetical protein
MSSFILVYLPSALVISSSPIILMAFVQMMVINGLYFEVCVSSLPHSLFTSSLLPLA